MRPGTTAVAGGGKERTRFKERERDKHPSFISSGWRWTMQSDSSSATPRLQPLPPINKSLAHSGAVRPHGGGKPVNPIALWSSYHQVQDGSKFGGFLQMLGLYSTNTLQSYWGSIHSCTQSALDMQFDMNRSLYLLNDTNNLHLDSKKCRILILITLQRKAYFYFGRKTLLHPTSSFLTSWDQLGKGGPFCP